MIMYVPSDPKFSWKMLLWIWLIIIFVFLPLTILGIIPRDAKQSVHALQKKVEIRKNSEPKNGE
jgi:hypothetical protein